MPTKENRLRSARDISRVYSKGSYVSNGIISIKSLQTRRPGSRVVVVVGKKVSKKATIRNRMRRRIVPIIVAQWQTVRAGYDIVITVHNELEGITPKKLESEIKYLLKKANLIHV
jgi:ribonuclease P protein component